MAEYLVAAFYKFSSLPDFADLREPLLACCERCRVKGTLLLAEEGVNGTIAGPPAGVREVLARLRSHPCLADLTHKESRAQEMPFYRMKVRLKKEIVTMGVSDIKPDEAVGINVKPQDWNVLINDPGTVVVDTRNTYEVDIGTFRGAVNPETGTFREFPDWAIANRERLKKKKIAMFCTGGIRCEKASAFMKKQGVGEIYRLDGGILKYLEDVPEEESLWEGECFVFDQRVSVTHGLKEGTYDQCYGCRHPVTEEEKKSPDYIQGVCCPRCINALNPDQKKRFGERQKQIQLARLRGRVHMGSDR